MELKSTDVPGLYYMSDFLSSEEESFLLKEIYKHPWKLNRSQTRKVQFYGVCHDSTYKIRKDALVIPLPDYTEMLIQRIKEIAFKFFPRACYMNDLGNSRFNELFVNQYLPEDELRFHRDHTVTYEDIIIGVSLGGHSTFRFQPYQNNASYIPDLTVNLAPRSIYFMTGKSRVAYKHGMKKGDIKEKRVSLTFRIVNKHRIN